MTMKLIRDIYNVPAKRGMKIKVGGRVATILSARNCRLRIEFDDEPGTVYSTHPTYQVEYPEEKE